MEAATLSRIGLAGLAVMGQNLALNIAEKGFPISVYNRTASKVDETVGRAASEGVLRGHGDHSPADFVLSIQRPRSIIVLVKAGSPVYQTITTLSQFMEPGDVIIGGGNEWYENTERCIRDAAARGSSTSEWASPASKTVPAMAPPSCLADPIRPTKTLRRLSLGSPLRCRVCAGDGSKAGCMEKSCGLGN